MLRVAAAQEVGVQRMREPVAAGKRRGHQRLAQDVAAEQVAEAEIQALADVEIAAGGPQVEQRQQVGQGVGIVGVGGHGGSR